MHATNGFNKNFQIKVAIGSDHAGYALKETIKKFLSELNVEYKDYGTHSTDPVDYPDIAVSVAKRVSHSEFPYGILICGSGIGMSIVANKVPGIRAALCCSEEMAKLSRTHNNANILTLAGRYTSKRTAKKIVKIFIETKFEPGSRHERRIKKIHQLTKA